MCTDDWTDARLDELGVDYDDDGCEEGEGEKTRDTRERERSEVTYKVQINIEIRTRDESKGGRVIRVMAKSTHCKMRGDIGIG